MSFIATLPASISITRGHCRQYEEVGKKDDLLYAAWVVDGVDAAGKSDGSPNWIPVWGMGIDPARKGKAGSSELNVWVDYETHFVQCNDVRNFDDGKPSADETPKLNVRLQRDANGDGHVVVSDPGQGTESQVVLHLGNVSKADAQFFAPDNLRPASDVTLKDEGNCRVLVVGTKSNVAEWRIADGQMTCEYQGDAANFHPSAG